MLLDTDCSKEEADFLVANYGSMIALSPMSAKANQACADGVIDFENWQVLGGTIMVDHRMAENLIDHLREDGFIIAEE